MSAFMEHWDYYIWFIGIPVVFIVIVLWVMRPKAKKHWKQDAKIPFEDKLDNNDHGESNDRQ